MDAELAANIAFETQRAMAAEGVIDRKITAEQARAMVAERQLSLTVMNAFAAEVQERFLGLEIAQ